MNTKRFVRTACLASSLVFFGSALAQQVTVVDMIPNSLSAETERDSEPNLAVNPAHPDQIMASAFTPDPMGTSNVPLYISTDGGHTWSLTTPAVIPGTSGSCFAPVCDITLRFASTSNLLYVSDLNPAGGVPRLDVWQLTNPTTAGVTSAALEQRSGTSTFVIPDQPYVEAATDSGSGHDRLVVAVNDLTQPSGRTATFDHTADATPPAPAGFSSTVLEARATTGQDLPTVRAAIHPSGVIYGVFYGIRSDGREVVVVRDDAWGTGTTPFRALMDTDGNPGIRVVSGLLAPVMTTITGLGVQPVLGTQRIGSQAAIAVDPTNSQTVYIVYAEGASPATYTLHVRSSTNGGAAWSADLTTVSPATNPGIAVNSSGWVGFMYQQLVNAKWETHFLRSTDGGSTWPTNVLLASVPDANGSYPGSNPIGDYLSLAAVGENFYGIFSANNTPDQANFHSGTVFQRAHDFSTKALKDLSSNTVPVSIDPFFVEIQPGPCERFPSVCNICELKPIVCYGIFDPWWWLKCPMCGINILVNPGDEYARIPVSVYDAGGRRVGGLQRLATPIVENGVTYTHHIALKPTKGVGYVLKAEIAQGKKAPGAFNPAYTVEIEPARARR